MRYVIPLILAFVFLGALWVLLRGRRPPAPNRQVTAARGLTVLANRLRASADQIGQPHSEIFWDMAGDLEQIRAEVQESQRDLNQARRFIGHHAPMIVGLAEKFVALEAKSGPEHAERLDRMAEQLRGYRDIFARVKTALIENDFAEMEATMDALDTQLARLDF